GLFLDGHLRLIHVAAPYGGNIDRNRSSRSTQQPVYWLARDLADRIPHGLFDATPVDQASLKVLFHGQKIRPGQRVAYLLKCVGVPTSSPAAAKAAGTAERISTHSRFRDHTRYVDAVHYPRFDFGGSRRNLDIERLDILDTDRLGLGRKGVD